MWCVWRKEEIRSPIWKRNLNEKNPLGRPSHRWQNNIQMNPEKVRREGVHWTYVAVGKRKCYSMVMNQSLFLTKFY
jgi:hypothetical protein